MSRLTVGQLAALAHISVRTLHHYDAIGLLAPSGPEAGYRVCGSLTPAEQFEVFGTDKLNEHLDEAKQRWGETSAWAESQRLAWPIAPEDSSQVRRDSTRMRSAVGG